MQNHIEQRAVSSRPQQEKGAGRGAETGTEQPGLGTRSAAANLHRRHSGAAWRPRRLQAKLSKAGGWPSWRDMQGCHAVLRMLWCAHLLAAAVVAARRAARAARQQLARRRPHSMRCCCCRCRICRSCSCGVRRCRRIRRPLHALWRSHFCGCFQRCRCYLVHPGVEAACVVAAASAAALPGCTRWLVPADQAIKRSA